MSKRRTIGENPLDLAVSKSPLDAVVPEAGRERAGPDTPEAAAERLEQLEEAVRTLRKQVAEVRMEMADIKNQLFRESYFLAQLKDKLAKM
ncbi:MAG: hypothetical protein JRI59_01170 [Deltaproteobacteria bacterium]|nr:hypothetical protein [Deltaproteobacteria bacterium]